MRIINNFNSSDTSARRQPVLLLLIDGWAVAPAGEANGFSAAKTPTILNLIKEYPVAVLAAGAKSWNARYLSLGTGRDLEDEAVATDSSLSSALSQAGWKQVKISETERFAALTHFFNGGGHDKLSGEDWVIISSQASPQTTSPLLAFKRAVREIIKSLEADSASFIVASLPYLDLVAKTGDFSEVKTAIEILDKNLKKIVATVLAQGGIMFMAAAGGNVEHMYHPGTGLGDYDLTNNPVPFFIIGQNFKGQTIGLADPLNNDLSLLTPAGTLADLTPTILQILNLPKPAGMTGKSLLE
ncbi:MAG: hypothetical protein WC863_02535 [Patescibacteria group bacterium]